ncbi:alkaline phosphatase D family protein [Aliiglaciecola sp. CAU 1673]|uniref:alkaline phosphatase D family protein n=1 Tax=Aliiglaciecola sp. CAU 1673 TaxID=3032595 RepID=UPI0023DCD4F8|nr:alkaline phosphatase D family protein [Aliiglaciecola sp. CAU 1673]MDF2177795.1 alkaline phosphatase D family protein [Aliiglaciecola sp. CAU 1673]
MNRALSLVSSLLLCTGALAAQQKILFGSCAHQDHQMPILNAINAEQPDLFAFLGDNIYGDTEDMTLLAAKYQKLATNPGFRSLKASTPLIAIWDDHDFGEDDAGAEYPQKEASRQIMLDFWGEPQDSARRQRPDGIYTSYTYGEGEQLIRVIMPDLRWNRPPLSSVGKLGYLFSRRPHNMGPYEVSEDPNASMLGETQWQWLEQELKKPAAIRIIASSLQLLPEFSGWEAWANYPADRNRLLKLIKEAQLNGVIVISGDTHWGELSKLEKGMDYPIWEITSSGLTEEWKDVSPNQHRVGNHTHNVNYGYLEIDWQQADPIIRFGLRDEKGNDVMGQRLPLSSISPY